MQKVMQPVSVEAPEGYSPFLVDPIPKEIPNIATNWFVCAVVLGLTQYPVMRAHWRESYARVYDMMGIDPDTGETVSEKKAAKKKR